jgi:hypothetical protein
MEFVFDPPGRSPDDWYPDLVGRLFADQGLCGRSVNHGLLRFHDAASAPVGQEVVDAMFRPRGLVADVFAFDWLARQFAVTNRLTHQGMPDKSEASRTVVVLDPFDGSVTPWVEVTVFDRALGTSMAQEFLQPELFDQWLTSIGATQLEFDWCAGAKVPAFYGGERVLPNLSANLVEVYLSFTRQLWEHGVKNGAGSPPPRLQTAQK